ncbi:MAG: hypothetical protein EWV67_21785 [Microcystis sp. M_QC_C_20170808_M2Col]|nr:MAG: hypothetical protein EWV67_21785 [Microcystis sp. M_QC_C_20170808_M2Col]TRT68335.1 MAG: hypothetical protein EWV68_11035 [Microcystis sp. M_QC_C_20170808_M9Col]
MGRWGDHCVRVAGGDGEMGEISTKTLKPQNPKTPKPNPQPLTPFFLFTFYLTNYVSNYTLFTQVKTRRTISSGASEKR